MSGLGTHHINDLLTFVVNTHDPDTGAAADADSAPTYRVYEDETGTAILTGTMALLDDANTVGQYSEQLTLSAANGFENGKSYNIRVAATVSTIAGAKIFYFKVDVPDVNVTTAAGTAWNSGAIQANTLAANTIAAAKIASGALTSAKFASGAFDAVWTVTTRVLTAGTNIQLPSNGLANVTAWTVNLTGSLSGSVGSVTGAVGSVTGGINTGAGTITTLDGLDTAQDTQHTTTQDLIGNLALGSAGVSVTAQSSTETTAGTPTNTYTATQQLDGVYHIVPDDGLDATDMYYEFDVGPNGVPVQVEWVGYAQAINESYAVYFYNWGGAAWEQVGTIDGTTGTTVQTKTFVATVAHVGTGANDGLVRLRFLSSDGAIIATDRILCTYTVISAALGYENGFVWVDEVAGTSSGTTPGVDGLITNRSDDFDNAQTIAAALGYQQIAVTNGNSITLSASIDNFIIGIPGSNWTLALGGQDVSNSDINDAEVSGTMTSGSGVTHFHNCILNTCTLPPAIAYTCGVNGTITVGSAGAYRFVDCYSDVPGSSAPVVDLGAAVGATTMEFRRWSGGLTLNNVQTGDVISVDVVSGGTITVNGTGGTVVIRGLCNVVDGSSGSVSITQTSVVNMTKINSEVDTAISDAALATAADLATVDGIVDNLNLGIIYGSAVTGTLSTTQATTDLTGYADDQLIGRVIIFTSGACDGEATDITDYANTSGLITFTAMTTAPSNGDTFKIV